jgi:2-O-methyltransferase
MQVRVARRLHRGWVATRHAPGVLCARIARRAARLKPILRRRKAILKALENLRAFYRKHDLASTNMPKTVLVPMLPYNAVIVEAGAHDGGDTVEFARLFPDARILSFEPHPKLFAVAREATRNLRNVVLENVALYDKKGKMPFHISSGTSDASSSLLVPKEHLKHHPSVKFEQSIHVDVIRLDDYLAAKQIKRIDFLWLDLQGAELHVLRTLDSFLSGTTGLFIEVSLSEVYEAVPKYQEVRNFLKERGFVAVFEQLPWADAGNVLFLNQALVDPHRIA